MPGTRAFAPVLPGAASAPPLPPAAGGLETLRAITVSHRAVGIDALARHSLDCDAAQALHQRLTEAGIASVVLATCNRAELYWRSHRGGDDDTAAHAFSRLTGLPAGTGRLTGSAAAAHLFRVCAGLESLVLGEAEILGQVRAALDACQGADGFLRGVVHAALRAGRQARAETALAVGAQSVASAAVQFLARALPVERSRVLVVGAGATGVKVARHLRAVGVGRLVVANRTIERATAVATALGAESASLDGLQDAIGLAHAVVCAVDAPAHIVSVEDLRWAAAARHGRPLMVVDLSMPPAVEPGDVAGVTRVDLAALQKTVAQQHDRRAAEIPKALAVVERELRHLEAWARRQALRPLLADLRRKLEAIGRAEIDRLGSERADAAIPDGGALERLTRRLIDRVIALPVGAFEAGHVTLDADQTRVLRRLFALDAEVGG
jgi:glutamyl-tRNA reductase